MKNWGRLLDQAEELAGQSRAVEAFRCAFGAMEVCFDQVAKDRCSRSEEFQNDRFMEIARALKNNRLLRGDEFALVCHLADARNLLAHRFGFEPSLDEARRTIERVRGLCGRFGSKVSDVMNKPVVTASPDEPIGGFIHYFVRYGYSQIPVVENGGLTGTLSDSAVLKAWQDGEGLLDPATPVRSLMSDSLIPDISPQSSVDDARRLMLRKKASALLVVNARLPVGILTKFDLLNHQGTWP